MSEHKAVEYRFRHAIDGQFYWVTRDPGNHEVLSTSEMYVSQIDALNGAIENGYGGDATNTEWEYEQPETEDSA